ncbi:GSCOCG00002788001-RA-CDS [Cotesia congregata]|nr:GSCOCG00002788001-RA-CDS [Cotesia congregata]
MLLRFSFAGIHSNRLCIRKPFPCHKCGRSYLNKGSLRRHLHDECGKPPQYICNICKKGFKQKTNFHRHNATVHPDRSF